MSACCYRYLPRSGPLSVIAPRLARARDGLVEQMCRDRARRCWHRERELHLEWLVSHRDLQHCACPHGG